MLLLLFRLGPDRYAIDAGRVIEVLPLVEWKEVPQVAPGVVGLINRSGAPIPLVDLQLMLYGNAARHRVGTRIIIVSYGAEGSGQRLGMIAEDVTETVRLDETAFVEGGVGAAATRALGRVAQHESELIQLVHPAELLSPDVADALYAAAPVGG